MSAPDEPRAPGAPGGRWGRVVCITSDFTLWIVLTAEGAEKPCQFPCFYVSARMFELPRLRQILLGQFVRIMSRCRWDDSGRMMVDLAVPPLSPLGKGGKPVLLRNYWGTPPAGSGGTVPGAEHDLPVIPSRRRAHRTAPRTAPRTVPLQAVPRAALQEVPPIETDSV